MRFRQIVVAGIGFALLAMLVPGGTARAAEPLKIRIGWTSTPNQLTPLLFVHPEILRHYGKSYTVEAMHFRGSAAQITAIAAGELEIGVLAFSSLGAAVENAHLTDIRIIGDVMENGVGDYYSSQYMVRGDSPIKTIADLRGKVLASNGIGGALDMGIRAMMHKNGMEPPKDYTLIEALFPNMPAMLMQGKADLVTAVPPYNDEMMKAGARVLFTLKDAFGPMEEGFWVARKPFLEANRPALYDFFEDVQLAIRWYLDPAHRDAAIATVAQFTKKPPQAYAGWLFTKRDYYRDPDARPNIAVLQQNMKTEQTLGFLKSDIDVAQYADLSFVDEAAKRLGHDAPKQEK